MEFYEFNESFVSGIDPILDIPEEQGSKTCYGWLSRGGPTGRYNGNGPFGFSKACSNAAVQKFKTKI